MKPTEKNTKPPFCVNPECQHFQSPKEVKWFRRCGFHATKAHGSVPRFICKTCGKTCSSQTFDLHYWSQRRLCWTEVTSLVKDCISDRALARRLEVSPNCIANKTNRLAKWALSIHSKMLKSHRLRENLCADGFETFAVSQYYPAHVNILVGSRSQFVYGWSHAHLRRKGRMTTAQKKKRALLEQTWRPPRGAQATAFKEGVTQHLETFMDNSSLDKLTMTTDEYRLYKTALARSQKLVSLSEQKRFEHVTVSSKLERTIHNPLFPVNYTDRELRKNLANHVRETTRFSREPNRMMDRMSLCFVIHNLEKDFRVAARIDERCKHWQMAGFPRGNIPQKVGGTMARPWLNPDIRSFFRDVWNHRLPVPQNEKIRSQAKFWNMKVTA